MTKQEEQLDPVDAMMIADETPETPTPESEAPQTPTDQPPEGPVPAESPETPVAQPLEQPEPPSEPEPSPQPELRKPTERMVSERVVIRKDKKLRDARQEIARLAIKVEELQKTQAKDVDPLDAFYANTENEGLAPSKELLAQHDAFVRTQAVREVQRPAEPVDIQQRIALADRVIDSDPNTKAALGWAISRSVLDKGDLLEIAQDADPLTKARQIIRESFEAEGNQSDLAVLNQLFPPQVPARPAPRPAAPKATAPAPKPQPKPKPQETADEDDLPQFPADSHAARVASYMFGH